MKIGFYKKHYFSIPQTDLVSEGGYCMVWWKNFLLLHYTTFLFLSNLLFKGFFSKSLCKNTCANLQQGLTKGSIAVLALCQNLNSLLFSSFPHYRAYECIVYLWWVICDRKERKNSVESNNSFLQHFLEWGKNLMGQLSILSGSGRSANEYIVFYISDIFLWLKDLWIAPYLWKKASGLMLCFSDSVQLFYF